MTAAPLEHISWTSIHLVSTSSTVDSLRPAIASDKESNIHVVWQEVSGSYWDLLYRRWNETARSWSSTEKISTESPLNSQRANVATDKDGNFYVVWLDNSNYLGAGSDSDVFFKFWNRTTGSWSTTEVVSTESTNGVNWPDICINLDIVHIVWQDTTNYHSAGSDNDLFYKMRFPNGTWTAAEVVTVGSSNNDRFPSITVDDEENIFLVWDNGNDWNDDPSMIFYAMRNTTGSSWSGISTISSAANTGSTRAQIIVDLGHDLHVVWSENTGGQYGDSLILYKSFDADQDTWSVETQISPVDEQNAEVPILLVDSSDNLHCFWFNGTQSTGDIEDINIFYSQKNITTGIWDIPSNIIDTRDKAWRPMASIGKNDIIHLVWQDRSPDLGGADWDILLSWGIPLKAELGFLDIPDDITYQINTTGHELVWTLHDDIVDQPTYIISRNSSNLVNSSWVSDTPIQLGIDGLNLGEYHFTLQATDGLGELIWDIVIVNVVPELPTNNPAYFTTLGEIGYGVLIAIGVVGITILLRRRKP